MKGPSSKKLLVKKKGIARVAEASGNGAAARRASGHFAKDGGATKRRGSRGRPANGRSDASHTSSSKTTVNSHPAINGYDNAALDGPAADRRLVDRCLAGDDEAWRELFDQQHHRLLASIRSMFGPGVSDANQVEEIAARVWLRVLASDMHLLDEFDVSQGCRLSTYLSTLARSSAVEMFRSDRRRRQREAVVSRPDRQGAQPSLHQMAWRVGEFLQCLTPREREFCLEVLLSRETDDGRYASTNHWQLRSRIRRKLSAFSEATP